MIAISTAKNSTTITGGILFFSIIIYSLSLISIDKYDSINMGPLYNLTRAISPKPDRNKAYLQIKLQLSALYSQI